MERYNILDVIGKGSWGKVFRAIHKETCEMVAVKRLKRDFYSSEECTSLPEVKILRKLNHPNIVNLKEIVREHNQLFLIFECMECDLYQKIKTQESPFCEEEIREFLSQILKGLGHMHRYGYFHRDLKPENLLVKSNVLKVADLGLAREVSSTKSYTEYVSTRWYRAPEVLFRSSSYTSAVDMWAVGAILAELFTLSPIFPGESEIDQVYKICSVLGAPEWMSFPNAKNIHTLIEVSFSQILPANISEIIPNASPEAIDLFKKLCSWDPLKRPTADQALQHPFFKVGLRFPRQPHNPLGLTLYSKVRPNLDLNLRESDSSSDESSVGLTLAVNSNPTDFGPFSAGIAHQVSRETGEDMPLDINLLPQQPRLPDDMLLDFNLFSQPQQPRPSSNMLVEFDFFPKTRHSSDRLLDFNISCQPQQSGDKLWDLNPSCQSPLSGGMLLDLNWCYQPQQSVSWPFIPPNQDGTCVLMDSSLSLPFSYPFQPPQIGITQLTGCTSASMRTYCLNQPLLATSSPFQL